MTIKRILLSLTLLFTAGGAVFSLGTFSLFNQRNHPELIWRVYETANFKIVYSSGLEETAREAGRISEQAYATHQKNLGLSFKKKYPIFISDVDDIANGATLPYGYFFVWVSPSRYPDHFTGAQPWLEKVIAHEMVHALIFENTRSWTNIFGPSMDVPLTVHEGYAQFFALEPWGLMRGERWLENAALHGSWKTWGITPDDGPLLYAKGFSQIRYLYAEHPEKASEFGAMFKRRDFFKTFIFKKAFEETFGESYKDYTKRWRKAMEKYYREKSERLESLPSISKPMVLPAFDVLTAVSREEDGSFIIDGIRKSKEPVRALYLVDPDTMKVKTITEQSFFGKTFPADQGYYYGKTIRGKHGSLYSDIYFLPKKGHKEEPLTRHERAFDPVFLSGTLYYLRNTGEGTALIARKEGRGEAQTLFSPLSGEELYDLSGSGKTLAAALFHPAEKRFYLFLYDIASETAELFPLSGRPFSPVISPDENSVIFGMDDRERGSLFRLEKKEPSLRQVTRQRGYLKPVQWAEEGLICITSQERSSMRACLIDPNRDPDLTRDVTRPAWMKIKPRASLTQEADGEGVYNGAYRPFSNLRLISLLPFYMDEEIYPGFMTVLSEPMGWHSLQAFVGIDDSNWEDVFYNIAYSNKRNVFNIDIAAWSHGDSTEGYLSEELLQRISGGRLSLSLPLDHPHNRYITHIFEAGGGYRKSDILNGDSFTGDEDQLPRDYSDPYLYFFYIYHNSHPRLIFPYHETGIHGGIAFSAPFAGKRDLSTYLNCDAYLVRRLSPFVLFFYGEVHKQWGELAPQDLPRIRSENHSFQEPFTGFRYDKRVSIRGLEADIPSRLIGALSAEVRYNYSFAEGALFIDTAFFDQGRLEADGSVATAGILGRINTGFMTLGGGYAWDLEDPDNQGTFFEIGTSLPF